MVTSSTTAKKGVYQPNGALTTSAKNNGNPVAQKKGMNGNLINPSEVYKIDGFAHTKTIKEFQLSQESYNSREHSRESLRHVESSPN